MVVVDFVCELEVGMFLSYYMGKMVIFGGDGCVEIDFEGMFGIDEVVVVKLSWLLCDVFCGVLWMLLKVCEFDWLLVGDWFVM